MNKEISSETIRIDKSPSLSPNLSMTPPKKFGTLQTPAIHVDFSKTFKNYFAFHLHLKPQGPPGASPSSKHLETTECILAT